MRIEQQPIAIAPERRHECDLSVAIGNRIGIAMINRIAPRLARFHFQLGDAMVGRRVRIADEDGPLLAIGGPAFALGGDLGAEDHAPVGYHRRHAQFRYFAAARCGASDCGDFHRVSTAVACVERLGISDADAGAYPLKGERNRVGIEAEAEDEGEYDTQLGFLHGILPPLGHWQNHPEP